MLIMVEHAQEFEYQIWIQPFVKRPLIIQIF